MMQATPVMQVTPSYGMLCVCLYHKQQIIVLTHVTACYYLHSIK